MRLSFQPRKHTSLRFMLLSYLAATLIPLLLIVFFNVIFVFYTLEQKISAAYQSELDFYLRQLDKTLYDVDLYLANLSNSNDSIVAMEYADKENQRQLAAVQIKNTLSSDILLYAPIEGIFVYSPKNDMFISNMESAVFHSYIQEQIADPDTLPRKWRLESYNGATYLLHIFIIDHVYYGAWVHAETLLSNITFSDNGILSWLSSEEETTAPTNKTGWIVSSNSSYGDWQLCVRIPLSASLSGFSALILPDFLLIAISLLLFPAYLLFLKRFVLLPIQSLTNAMSQLRDGNLEYTIAEDTGTEEFRLMSRTFNGMRREITTLKINVYEEQIEKQRLELDKLQMQTNPHFFMNSLNIIYSLAQTKDFDLIREMTRCLAEYYRYITHSDRPCVSVQEELTHVRRYLRIQELRFPDRFLYHIDADPGLLECQLPPMTILIFVENVIKHGLRPDTTALLEIAVFESSLYPDEFFTIEIRDNGPGFPNAILTRLQNGENCSGGQHVGIQNVKRRLRLLYQDRALLTFKNAVPSGGAVVTVRIPFFTDSMNRQEENHVSTADC